MPSKKPGDLKFPELACYNPELSEDHRFIKPVRMNHQTQLANRSSRTRVREDNKLRPEDCSAHDWYRFVLSFPPHLVREYLARFGVGSTKCVLDPFCGTGTTLVECKKLEIPSVGIEANPIAWFASTVKTDWNVDPSALLKHAEKVAQIALKRLAAQGIEDCPTGPLFTRKRNGGSRLKSLDGDAEKLLLKESISPLPLHKSLTLLETIDEEKDARFSRHERLALAKCLVNGISNLEFGPEVGVGVPKKDAAVVGPWLDSVRAMGSDLKKLWQKAEIQAVVHMADSRRPLDVLLPRSIDVVITSPPYPNEKDYTRTTRLESVLLGFIRNRRELRSLKDNLVRSNTRCVFKSDRDDLFVSGNKEIEKLARAIEARRIELGKTSGFERLYARVTKLYFGGMTRHLTQLRTVLRPGAHLAYVVGDQASYLRVMIRTGQVLADIAEMLGYEVVGIDLFRTRLATATREQLREEVVLLRWPGNKASENQAK